mgnify:CR=1 FL=1
MSGGNSYSGKFFEMTANVDANGVSVGTSNAKAGIQPFRAYLLPNSHTAAARSISMQMEDADATGIDCIQTIDEDGTSRYYDLNGRELPGKPAQGMFIYNGKKYINK